MGAATGTADAAKSLAEIQAEESRTERDRQDRLKVERQARQKEMNLGQASVWGNASANLSWGDKDRGASTATVVNAVQNRNGGGGGGGGGGFWEETATPECRLNSRLG